MKLELWLKKNDNGKSDCFDLTIGQEEILTGNIKNLHVIGTCDLCRFPENGYCYNRHSEEFCKLVYPNKTCIHFEPKEMK